MEENLMVDMDMEAAKKDMDMEAEAEEVEEAEEEDMEEIEISEAEDLEEIEISEAQDLEECQEVEAEVEVGEVEVGRVDGGADPVVRVQRAMEHLDAGTDIEEHVDTGIGPRRRRPGEGRPDPDRHHRHGRATRRVPVVVHTRNARPDPRQPRARQDRVDHRIAATNE